MVKVRYLGLSNPVAEFNALRPYRDHLIRMGSRYRHSSVENQLLDEARQALDRACLHFTGDERFYWFGDTGGVGGAK